MDRGIKLGNCTFDKIELDDNSISDKEVRNVSIMRVQDNLQKFWKGNMEARLDDLTRRVIQLELLEQESNLPRSNTGKVASFSTLESTKWFGLATCAKIIRTKRVATIQCFWLIICILGGLYCGVTEFARARSNVLSNHKPLTLERVEEYGLPGSEEWNLPDLYFRVRVRPEHNLEKDIDKALSLMESMFGPQGEQQLSEFLKKPFDTYCMYFDTIIDWMSATPYADFGVTWVDYNISWGLPWWKDAAVSNPSFIGLIHIKLGQPDPIMGDWTCLSHINLTAVTLDFTAELIDLEVFMDREVPDIEYGTFDHVMAIEGKATNNLRYSYEEKKHKLMNGDEISVVTDEMTVTNGGYFRELFYQANEARVVTQLVLDPRVEIWSEYVEYGYEDWVFAMGGMLSLASIAFFWGAYKIVKYFGQDIWTMGITPIMSFTFHNLERILWVKYRLQKLNILPKDGAL